MERRRGVCFAEAAWTERRLPAPWPLPRKQPLREEGEEGAAWLPITEEDHLFFAVRADREERDELRLVGIDPSSYTETESVLLLASPFEVLLRDNALPL